MAASSRGPSLGLDAFGTAPRVKFGVGRIFFKFVLRKRTISSWPRYSAQAINVPYLQHS